MVNLKKINLLIFALIIAVILAVSLAILPVFKEIQRNSKELVLQKGNLAALDAKIENLNQLKISYSEFEAGVKEMDGLFINPELPVEFISFLEKIAKDSGVEIKISSSAFNQNKEGKWPFLNFQINTASSFPKLLSFLEKIENAPYLIEIQNLNINQLKRGNQVQASINLKVYTQ